MTARTSEIGKKRASAKTAKNKATALHSKIVRARGRCEACQGSEPLQCAHIVSRRFSATRTRLDNAFCLCAGCHMRFTEWPLEFAQFTIGRIGQKHYEELRYSAYNGTAPDWHKEVERLSAIWADIEDSF